MNWRTLSNKPIESLEEFLRTPGSVHIGTDSLQTAKSTEFVTVIAIVGNVAGRAINRAAYRRHAVPRIKSLREKLLREVWLSVELGLEIEKLVKGELTVHIDANADLKFRSGKYVQELVGAVVSQGFKAEIKPKAWLASHVADHVVRHLGKVA